MLRATLSAIVDEMKRTSFLLIVILNFGIMHECRANSCDGLGKVIRQKAIAANYCQSDEDCIALKTGAVAGCYLGAEVYVNRSKEQELRTQFRELESDTSCYVCAIDSPGLPLPWECLASKGGSRNCPEVVLCRDSRCAKIRRPITNDGSGQNVTK